MKKKTIDEINKLTSPFSCLFVGNNGRLIRLNTPFKVIAIISTPEFSEGEILIVNKVVFNSKIQIGYVINNKIYNHFKFNPL